MSDWIYDLMPYLLGLSLTSIPAYFGAWTGHRNAELQDLPPANGALLGAVSAVKWVFGGALTLVVFGCLAACMMSAVFLLAAVVIGLIGYVCVLMAAHSAGFAAVFASQRWGARGAGLAAALAAPLGVLIAIGLLKYGTNGRSRYSYAPYPVAAVTCSIEHRSTPSHFV